MPVTYRYSNHRLIHASSLGSAHSRLIVFKPHYIHESLAHSCLTVHGSLMPHDGRITRATGTKGVEVGRPGAGIT